MMLLDVKLKDGFVATVRAEAILGIRASADATRIDVERGIAYVSQVPKDELVAAWREALDYSEPGEIERAWSVACAEILTSIQDLDEDPEFQEWLVEYRNSKAPVDTVVDAVLSKVLQSVQQIVVDVESLDPHLGEDEA